MKEKILCIDLNIGFGCCIPNNWKNRTNLDNDENK